MGEKVIEKLLEEEHTEGNKLLLVEVQVKPNKGVVAMPDKRAVCSLADSIVFDYIPGKVRKVIDRNIGISEDIKAAVRGMKDETLMITNKGVYIIKKGKCNFFPYDNILDEKYVHRVYRRGRFEIPLKEKGRVRLPDESKEPDFGLDPAPNVVNFAWHKFELFSQAAEILSVNKEIHDSRKEKSRTPEVVEMDLIQELMEEIKNLKKELAELKEEKAQGM